MVDRELALRIGGGVPTIVVMSLRSLVMALATIVLIGAHVSHVPVMVADAASMVAMHAAPQGMATPRADAAMAAATADGVDQATDAPAAVPPCVDVLLTIPARSALLAVAALAAVALLVMAPIGLGDRPRWPAPTVAPDRRRALLQVYLS